jgi:hypothetical protein
MILFWKISDSKFWPYANDFLQRYQDIIRTRLGLPSCGVWPTAFGTTDGAGCDDLFEFVRASPPIRGHESRGVVIEAFTVPGGSAAKAAQRAPTNSRQNHSIRFQHQLRWNLLRVLRPLTPAASSVKAMPIVSRLRRHI